MRRKRRTQPVHPVLCVCYGDPRFFLVLLRPLYGTELYSYHVRHMVRIHLVQELIVEVRVGKVVAGKQEQTNKL